MRAVAWSLPPLPSSASWLFQLALSVDVLWALVLSLAVRSSCDQYGVQPKRSESDVVESLSTRLPK